MQGLWGFSAWGAGFTELVNVLPGEWLSERDRDGHKEMGKWLPRYESVLLYVFFVHM